MIVLITDSQSIPTGFDWFGVALKSDSIGALVYLTTLQLHVP